MIWRSRSIFGQPESAAARTGADRRVRLVGCVAVMLILAMCHAAFGGDEPNAPAPEATGAGAPGLDASQAGGDRELEAAESGKTDVDDGAAGSIDFEELAASLDDSMDAMDLFDLEVPVVVSATRREQALNVVPQAMSVITAEDIRWSGARSVPDALRLAAGVDVAELSYGHYAVSPRGFHGLFSDKVLVLVDGRQIYDTIMAGTFWKAWPFMLEDIERIEVIRGPGGVAWGANAVNGVINIITKKPANQKGVKIITGGASRGTYNSYFGCGVADDRFALRVSGEVEGSDAFLPRGVGLFKAPDDYDGGSFSARATYQASKKDVLSFSLGSDITRNNYPLAWLARWRTPPARWQSNYATFGWTRTESDTNQYELLFYVNDFHTMAGPLWLDYRYQQYAASFRNTVTPEEGHTFTWGIDSRMDITNTTGSDPFMLTRDIVHSGIVGAYLQHEWQLAERWRFGWGARVDYDAYGGFQPSARAALSHQLNEREMIFASVSRAFHMPPASRRFLRLPVADPIGFVTGHQDLEPERLLAYELGYRGRHFDNLDVSANLFWHDYREVLGSAPQLGPPGLINIRETNSIQTGLYGLELEGRWQATSKLQLLGNYTYQMLDSDTDLTQGDGISPPEHKFMLGARYSATEDLHLSSHVYFVDDVEAANGDLPVTSQKIDKYWRLDLRAEYEFWDDSASFAVGVRNLLDKGHLEGGSTSIGNLEVPRMVFAEFRLAIEPQ